MGWWILIGMLALISGALASVTTVGIHRRGPSDPIVKLTIIWPSGPVTYRWPKDGK